MLRPFSLLFFAYCLLSSTLLPAQALQDKGLAAPTQQRDPVLRADGKLLYFTRPDAVNNIGPRNATDIWTRVRYDDGSWGRTLNPGSPINSFAHDRLVGLSPDGTRMAVLRLGVTNYLDLLVTSGRNWRITGSWDIPKDVAQRFDLTVDLNALRVIYSAADATGNQQLFSRQLKTEGEWAEPQALDMLNGPLAESSPLLAPDGRTLYFRRNLGGWFKQSDRGTLPLAVDVPEQVQHFSPALSTMEVIAAEVSPSGKYTLTTFATSVSTLPAAGALYRGFFTSPGAPGNLTRTLNLNNGKTLPVVTDAANRYAVFLRDGEQLATAFPARSAVMTATDGRSYAASGTALSPTTSSQAQLQADITRRQRELDRLDAERRRYEQAAPPTVDPELAALRNQFYQSTREGTDTIPPGQSAESTSRNSRYAQELAELERMKAKFRQQQNGKLGQRKVDLGSRSAGVRVQPPSAASGPSRGGRPLNTDSLRLASEIRNGLNYDVAPRAYDRQDWTADELHQGMPRPASPEAAAALDAEYARKLAEVEAMRAKLKGMDGYASPAPQPTPTTPYTANSSARDYPSGTTQQANTPDRSQWTARSPSPTTYAQPNTGSLNQSYVPPASQNTSAPAAPAPGYAPTATYGQPPQQANFRQPSGVETTGLAMPTGITFIPNTAYPDTRGYTGLDNLLPLIRQSVGVVDIRVHTDLRLDARVAQLLSEERAITIRNFLRSQGVPDQQYTITGYGNNLTGQDGERVEVVR